MIRYTNVTDRRTDGRTDHSNEHSRTLQEHCTVKTTQTHSSAADVTIETP